MKTPTLKPLAIIALLLFACTVDAQDQTAAKSGSSFRPALLPPEKMVFEDILFEDTLIRDVVQFLRKEVIISGLNFIVSDDVTAIPITLQLRRVSFAQLLTAVEIATGGNVVIEAVSGVENLYHVRPGKEAKPRPEPVLRVFNLSKFLDGKKDEESEKALEELHQTVEIAFEMLAKAQRAAGKRRGTQQKVDTKFHPGTKLMIVIGNPADVDVFHEVISQLTGVPRPQARTNSPFGMMGGMSGAGDAGYGGESGMNTLDDIGSSRGPRSGLGGGGIGGAFGDGYDGGGGLGQRKTRR